MRIDLSKDAMQASFLRYLEELFRLPEVENAKVRGIAIGRESIRDAGMRAFDAGYHDCFSDVDLSVKVCLPKNGTVTPEEYMARIDRFGVTEDTALGWMFVPENSMYRIVFRSGMRYDLGFDFEYAGNADLILGEQLERKENDKWPTANIDRFWFIQVQALGKLYRRDNLIGSHLANMNCNETLVMQMVLRDIEHGTNHHRYGYSEELEYARDLGKLPYHFEDPTFRRIADHLYAAALTHERLVKNFYPAYRERCDVFFSIWDSYEASYRGNRIS